MTAPYAFVSAAPAVPRASAPVVHAMQSGSFLAPVNPAVNATTGSWSTGLLASVAGAAAAMAGLHGGQKSAGKRMARRRVVQNATALDQLKEQTIVVADTGVLEDIQRLKPQDATTNPSLVLKALSGPDAGAYFERALAWANKSHVDTSVVNDELVDDIGMRLAVLLGSDILKVVPGLISTEVDARLSFNSEMSLKKALKIVRLYEEQGYGKDRFMVKLGSTWEAIPVCEQLEKEGIHCNMTLIFSIAQAAACAEAGATLISPFVGRILDWYKKNNQRDYTAEEDPGVKSVGEIYTYYKSLGFDTVVMGASFRSPYEVLELAGCDKMTISPDILDQLAGINVKVQRKLSPEGNKDPNVKHLQDGGMTEERFRWLMNQNPMATEMLSSGIRGFADAGVQLDAKIKEFLLKR